MKSRFILCATMLAAASVSRAQYTPIAIQPGSYNADVIVEANATPRLDLATSATIDQGTNNYANTLFEVGFDRANPANGVPAAGSTFTSRDNANYSFQMAPSYKVPNGFLIGAEVQTATMTLVTPAAYTTLSFLGLGGNGGNSMTATIHHLDGTTETQAFATPDWFNGTTELALIMGGRCTQSYNLTTEVSGNGGDGLGNPRLYHREVTLTDTTSPVTNIVLTYTGGAGGSHSDVMALSGATTGGGVVAPIAITGYTYDFVVEASAPQAPARILSQTMNGGTNMWATDQSLDNDGNTGAAWYEQGYNQNNAASGSFNNPLQNFTGTGLPHPGNTLTNSTGNHIYQMPPDYTVANSIYISDVLTNDTITLTTPAAFSGLSFLGAAGNGPVSVNYIITHQGGSTESGVLSIPDWFNGSSVAYVVNGRVQVDNAEYENINSGNPVLHQVDIVLSDYTDPVTSIYLENTNTVAGGVTSGRFSILAISGSTGPVPPIVNQNPNPTNVYVGSPASFTGSATANATITYQWQKQTNGVYGNLVNGGNISGVTTTTLTINPVGFADQANYRLVATDSAGSGVSSAAALGAFSSETDVTQPGDPISGVNISPFGDGSPAYTIDNSMSTKFGANITSGQVPGLVVSPVVGLTAVNGLRIYTGSDTTSRDPASYKVEGSIDGGHTYTLIASNSIVLTDNRNTSANVAPNPLTMFVTEVDFPNATGYTTYKISFPTQKGSGQIQFQEMELLGSNVTGFFFAGQPADGKAFDQTGSAYFSAYANGATSQSWFKVNNGTYVPLSDGGNISGSQSSGLSIYPVTFADAADYVTVAYDGSQYITSSIAHLFVYSTNTDVTQPTDVATGFGDISGLFSGNGPALAFDDTFTEYKNGGNGFSATAGFPPFIATNAPYTGVGVIVTPAVGSTVLSGIRFYPGQDSPQNDPSDYLLEGSNDGNTWTAISSGNLSLPAARNDTSLVVDPVSAWAQEILFSNTKGYTGYRITFTDVVASTNVSYLELGDIELLGVPGVGVAQPVISTTTLSGGNLHMAGSGGTPNGTYSVVTNGDLTVPVGSWTQQSTGTYDASGNFSISLPVSASNHQLFYLIKTP